MIKVAPSVLSADYLNLKEQLKALEEGKAEWLHFDVMDGQFVPNLTFGPKILSDMSKGCSLFKDVHIMVEHPLTVAPWFTDADLITFHYEALDDISASITLIHSLGKQAGISVKPKTDVTLLTPYLDQVELVLVMSVEPGFGGQKFMADMLEKVRWLKQYREEKGLSYVIEIDGGINGDTAKLAAEAGCDILVAGSYVFKGDIKEKIRTLHLSTIRYAFEAENRRAAAYDNDKCIGVCEFSEEKESRNITHTKVDSAYQGLGIAKGMLELIIEKSREENKELSASCSYAKKYLEK